MDADHLLAVWCLELLDDVDDTLSTQPGMERGRTDDLR
jgi:hypothetical protein